MSDFRDVDISGKRTSAHIPELGPDGFDEPSPFPGLMSGLADWLEAHDPYLEWTAVVIGSPLVMALVGVMVDGMKVPIAVSLPVFGCAVPAITISLARILVTSWRRK